MAEKGKGIGGGVFGFLIDFGKILLHTFVEVLKQAFKMGGEAFSSMRKMMK